MSVPLARKVKGKKFMWDGIMYETQDLARQTAEAYEKDGFEVQMFAEEDQYLVYSRRIAAVQTEG
jgi:hypothetical protein